MVIININPNPKPTTPFCSGIPSWSPKGVVGFRVRVNINDNKDRIRVRDDVGMMMNNVMVRLISSAGLRA